MASNESSVPADCQRCREAGMECVTDKGFTACSGCTAIKQSCIRRAAGKSSVKSAVKKGAASGNSDKEASETAATADTTDEKSSKLVAGRVSPPPVKRGRGKPKKITTEKKPATENHGEPEIKVESEKDEQTPILSTPPFTKTKGTRSIMTEVLVPKLSPKLSAAATAQKKSGRVKIISGRERIRSEQWYADAKETNGKEPKSKSTAEGGSVTSQTKAPASALKKATAKKSEDEAVGAAAPRKPGRPKKADLTDAAESTSVARMKAAQPPPAKKARRDAVSM